MVERFGLFMHILVPGSEALPRLHLSAWIGMAFIIMGGVFSVLSIVQHRRVLRTLKPIEIPKGYWPILPILSNLTLTLMSILLSAYMLHTVFKH